MSDPLDPDDERPDTDTLAGEYVLGVLEEADRRSVRLRSRTDPALAAAIGTWEQRLGPLAVALPPVPPPASVWTRLEDAIAALPLEEQTPMVRRGRRWAWPVATGVSLALAAGLAAFIVLQPKPGSVGIAAIAPINAPAAFVLQAKADGSLVLASVSPQAVPADRDFELWELPPGAAKVASLGVLSRDGGVVRLSAVPASGTQFLVSLEPRGGSPTGQPTGPVLYGGTFARALR